MKEESSNYRKKNVGQIFTPIPMVKLILDFAGYSGERILCKHIIDNSCGEGAFLGEAVHRYCRQFLSLCKNRDRLKQELATYIHGIEIEPVTYHRCIEILDEVAKIYGVRDVAWDVHCANTLHVDTYDGRMDFVVGNPPYVRVHNLKENYDDVKRYASAEKGMTDLYIVFLEIGFRMMQPKGSMTLITPSSWLTSKAGATIRKSLVRSPKLKKVIDLAHRQAFKGVTTYTLISHFENHGQDGALAYYRYDEKDECPCFISTLSQNDYLIQGQFFLGSVEQLAKLRKIQEGEFPHTFQVKNGFASLADNVFFGNVPESPITISVLKASTGVWTKGLFPYTAQGDPLAWSYIETLSTVCKYLESKKEYLLKGRPSNDGWYLYGRTQALRDVCHPKVAINTLIRHQESLKIESVSAGYGLYSGLYILGADAEEIRQYVETDDFIDYVALLRNYKSGGYYTYSSKSLEQYLNYQRYQCYGQFEKRSIPSFCGTLF